MSTIDVITRSAPRSTREGAECRKCKTRQSAFSSSREAFERDLLQSNWLRPPLAGHKFTVNDPARYSAVARMLDSATKTALFGCRLVSAPPRVHWVLGAPADLDFTPIPGAIITYEELPGDAGGSPWVCSARCERALLARETVSPNATITDVDMREADAAAAERERAERARGPGAQLHDAGPGIKLGRATLYEKAAQHEAKVKALYEKRMAPARALTASILAGEGQPAVARDSTRITIRCPGCPEVRELSRWQRDEAAAFQQWCTANGYVLGPDGVPAHKGCVGRGKRAGGGIQPGHVVGVVAMHDEHERWAEARERQQRGELPPPPAAPAPDGTRPARAPRKGTR